MRYGLSFVVCVVAVAACSSVAQPDASSDVVGPLDGAAETGADTVAMDAVDVAPVDASRADSGNDAVLLPDSPGSYSFAVRFANDCGLMPCGGSPVGRWRYAELCTADPLAMIRTTCPGLTTDVRGTGLGTIEFDATTVRRDVTARIDVRATVPPTCALVGCDTVQRLLVSAGLTDAACMTTAIMGCECTFSMTNRTMSSGLYMVVGNQVQVIGGAAYDHCVAGGSLSYREAGMRPSEPWTARLVPR